MNGGPASACCDVRAAAVLPWQIGKLTGPLCRHGAGTSPVSSPDARSKGVPLVIPRDGPRSIAVCPPWVKAGAPL
jgi:hypothetical protein